VQILEEPNVALLLELLVAAAIVAGIVRYVRIPYTVALVLVGLGLALLPDAPHVVLTPGVILTVFLPVLLFYGAYNLDARDLRANLTPVALLALPGVVATAGLVGAAMHWLGGLSWTDGLLLGTIVAATDPVAVLAIFREMGAPRRLATIVTAESLFNDGTALVFYSTMVAIALGVTTSPALTLEQFLLSVVGALVLGITVGIVGSALLARIDDALLETTITLIMAYGGYLLAEHFGISGPLETVTAGMFLGVSGRRVMSPTTRLEAGATWEFVDFVANSLLFLLVGLELRPIAAVTFGRLGLGVIVPLIVVLVAVIVARGIVVAGVSHILGLTRAVILPTRWQVVLVWAGLRGAVSLAAALSLPSALPARDLLVTLTFGVVLFTLVVQGLTTRPLLTRLGLAHEADGEAAVQLSLGRLQALDVAIREAGALQRTGALADSVAETLRQRYADRREQIHDELEALYQDNPDVAETHTREALRQLLHVEREAVRDLAARGQLSATTLDALIQEIDGELAGLERVAVDPQREQDTPLPTEQNTASQTATQTQAHDAEP
jgi:monovalent cation:H+ antiporter, CPA1 family